LLHLAVNFPFSFLNIIALDGAMFAFIFLLLTFIHTPIFSSDLSFKNVAVGDKQITAIASDSLPKSTTESTSSTDCGTKIWDPSLLSEKKISEEALDAYIRKAQGILDRLREENILEILMENDGDIEKSLEFIQTKKDSEPRKSTRKTNGLICDLELRGIRVGAAIDGWFKDDSKSLSGGSWYPGVITEINFEKDSYSIILKYDDGESGEVEPCDFDDPNQSGIRLRQFASSGAKKGKGKKRKIADR
jgi:hypothetical protein